MKLATVVVVCLVLAAGDARAQSLSGHLSEDGIIVLDPGETAIEGIDVLHIVSEGGFLQPAAHPDPFPFFLANNAHNVSYAVGRGATATIEDLWVTGIGYTGPPETCGFDLVGTYSSPGFGGASFPWVCTPPVAVPEPTAVQLVFVAISLASLLRKRHRSMTQCS